MPGLAVNSLSPPRTLPSAWMLLNRKSGKLMYRNQVVLGVLPSSSGNVTTASVNPSRGTTKASGPWLLSISVVAPDGGSTMFALAT